MSHTEQAPAAQEVRPSTRSSDKASARGWAFLGRLLLSAGTVAAMLPLMEIGVRVVAPQPPSWLDIYRRHPALPFVAIQPNVHATIDTGDARWTVHTDEQGFRVRREGATADGRPVLLWLGDSFTFAYGVDYERSFVGRLAEGSRYRHVNAAVGGYGPTQYRRTLEYLLEEGLRPQVVLVGVFLGNDFTDPLEDKDLPVQDGIAGNEGGLKSFLKRRFHLYRLAAATIHRLYPYGARRHWKMMELNARVGAWTTGELRGADATFRQEFEQIATICRSQGIELAVLLLPSPTMADTIGKGTTRNPEGTIDETLPLQHALAAFQDLRIRHLDLTPVLAAEPVTETYFYFDGHLTARGNALVTEAVARAWGDLLAGDMQAGR